MGVYKSPTGDTWFVQYQFTDIDGKLKNVRKRGFKTKREAVKWESESRSSHRSNAEMKFSVFVREKYYPFISTRVKRSTMATKKNIIEKHIIPFFGDMMMPEITTREVIEWQNRIMSFRDSLGNEFEESFLKTIHNQLSAIFNFAVRHYDLSKNPAAIVGNMGTAERIEMKFWTLEQYQKFREVMQEEPRYYYCFEVLYWGGLREGEMLALTAKDIDFNKKTISITKTYMRLGGEDLVTSPKTPQSIRDVTIPDFLCDELKEYIGLLYDLDSEGRLFEMSKSQLTRALRRGAQKAGVPIIRIHDLRHSAASLLIHMGYAPLAIAKRLGHSSIDITYRYAHLFPTVQGQIADSLEGVGSSINAKEF